MYVSYFIYTRSTTGRQKGGWGSHLKFEVKLKTCEILERLIKMENNYETTIFTSCILSIRVIHVNSLNAPNVRCYCWRRASRDNQCCQGFGPEMEASACVRSFAAIGTDHPNRPCSIRHNSKWSVLFLWHSHSPTSMGPQRRYSLLTNASTHTPQWNH